MSRFAHTLPGFAFVASVAVLGSCAQPANLPASRETREVAAAGSDSVVKARVEQVVPLPVPGPDVAKPFKLRACFDVDTSGRGRLLLWSRTRDSTYNERVLAALRGYRFRAARQLNGTPIRDTLCVESIARTIGA